MNMATLIKSGLLAMMLLPVVAFAHAFPQSSEPSPGAVIHQSPAQVVIHFNSYLEPLFNQLVVKDASGKVVSKGKAQVGTKDKARLFVDLPLLNPGSYHVYWKVTAKDGHKTQGDYRFTLK
jgi:methionine-rich copper-binding protein CopC